MRSKFFLFVLFFLFLLVFLSLSGWSEDDQHKPELTPLEKIETAPTQQTQKGFGIGLRFYGGLGYLAGGDINPGLEGLLDAWDKVLFLSLAIRTGEYKPIHTGFNGGFDILLRLQPNWGITLGVDYLQASQTSEIQFSGIGSYTVYTFAPRVSAIPVKLGLFVEKPLGKKMSLFLHGGLGYYLSRFHFEFRSAYPGYWEYKIADTDAASIGFHGGAALEMKLSAKLFFFIEALGRYARVSGFAGTENKDSSSGSSQSYAVTIYFWNGNYPQGRFHSIMPLKEFPDDPNYSDVREALVDFSGFSLRAGIRIKF